MLDRGVTDCMVRDRVIWKRRTHKVDIDRWDYQMMMMMRTTQLWACWKGLWTNFQMNLIFCKSDIFWYIKQAYKVRPFFVNLRVPCVYLKIKWKNGKKKKNTKREMRWHPKLVDFLLIWVFLLFKQWLWSESCESDWGGGSTLSLLSFAFRIWTYYLGLLKSKTPWNRA